MENKGASCIYLLDLGRAGQAKLGTSFKLAPAEKDEGILEFHFLPYFLKALIN
jgi:hypothetical protein